MKKITKKSLKIKIVNMEIVTNLEAIKKLQ